MAGLVLVLVTGCSSASGSAAVFPDRPYSLDVAVVDPCSGLTDDQLEAMNLREGSAGTSHGGSSRGCTWPGDDGVGYSLQTFDSAASAALGAEPTSTVVTVAGFGAVQSSPPATATGLPFCQVVLDVADEASRGAPRHVGAPGAGRARHPVGSTCARIRAGAGLMLDNLRRRQAG